MVVERVLVPVPAAYGRRQGIALNELLARRRAFGGSRVLCSALVVGGGAGTPSCFS